jgi:hypothetical protein
MNTVQDPIAREESLGDRARNVSPSAWVVAAVPVLLMLSAVALRVWWPDAYFSLVAEDALVEWLSFVGYAIAAVLAAAVAVLLHRRGMRLDALLWAGLVAGLVFVALEEITYGQRQLGFDGPERLVELNRQDEANLHNLLNRPLLHGAYLAVGLYGMGAGRWLLLRLRPLKALRNRPWLYTPDLRRAPWFAAVFVFYVYMDFLNYFLVLFFGPELDWSRLETGRIQEVAELALAGGFLLFTLDVLRRLRGRPRSRW